MDEIKVLVLAIFLLLGAFIVVDLTSLGWESVIAPKREEVRRKTWENTRSFKEGKRQELVRYRHQYLTAKTKGEKMVIASTVRLSFADVNREGMEKELKEFLEFCFNDRKVIE